eukprot:365735-Chlamydomonas_euryale.AAC.5
MPPHRRSPSLYLVPTPPHYLPHPDPPPPLVLPLTRLRCTKWMCHKCGRAKWTDTRPEVALWSERGYYCRNGCTERNGGSNTWDEAQVRANAHDLDRAHCKACRERIITARLVQRPSRSTGGGADAPAAPPQPAVMMPPSPTVPAQMTMVPSPAGVSPARAQMAYLSEDAKDAGGSAGGGGLRKLRLAGFEKFNTGQDKCCLQ